MTPLAFVQHDFRVYLLRFDSQKVFCLDENFKSLLFTTNTISCFLSSHVVTKYVIKHSVVVYIEWHG